MQIHHINCGRIVPPAFPPVPCHCLVLEAQDHGLILVDTGLGLEDCRKPDERLGRPLIEAVGFDLDERFTVVRELERLGLPSDQVRHIVLTHADPDHTGGLADFPDADVFVTAEELAALQAGDPRYVPAHFEHGPRWRPVDDRASVDWFGLKARQLPFGDPPGALLLPLFGHTAGHCGVAIRQDDRWLLHVGDAWYLRGNSSRTTIPSVRWPRPARPITSLG